VGAVQGYIVCKSLGINMTTQHNFEVRVDNLTYMESENEDQILYKNKIKEHYLYLCRGIHL